MSNDLFDGEDIFKSAIQDPSDSNENILTDISISQEISEVNLMDDVDSSTPPAFNSGLLQFEDHNSNPLDNNGSPVLVDEPLNNAERQSPSPPAFDVSSSTEKKPTPISVATLPPITAVDIQPPIIIPRKREKADNEEMLNAAKDDPSKNLAIELVDYSKIESGLSSYVVYKVHTKVIVSGHGYKMGEEMTVDRRFSDFLGLHDKLAAKHLHNGRIVPPAPEKDVIGMTRTKVKQVDEDQNSQKFLELRKCALERFLRRIARHPVLIIDPDFRDFLTMQSELPKATNTSAISGAAVVRLFSKIGDSVTKMAYRIEDDDTYFENKHLEIENLDEQFRRLHTSMEALVIYRKELASSTESYCKSMSLLAACEENTALSRAFSQLSETQEKIGLVHAKQADQDFYVLCEVFKDYLAMIQTIKNVFHERVKCWQAWQTAQQTLARKRENKTRMELAGRNDKLPALSREVDEWSTKVTECQEAFETISKIIRLELARFDLHRVNDFKAALVQYLDSLSLSQQQVIKYWEAFLPEAKAINAN